MPDFKNTRLFSLRNWISVLAAFGFFKSGTPDAAQDSSATNTPNNVVTNAQDNSSASVTNAPDNSYTNSITEKKTLELRIGPFDLHPRLVTGLTYDDNILFTTDSTAANPKEADTIWSVQPALQAVAGDDAYLIEMHDQPVNILNLSPGGIIVQHPENWPGKMFILDYGPRFQIFDQYPANNSIDQLGALNFLWPMSKLILGFRQDYQLQKTEVIEAGQRTRIESISSALSAAYQFGDKTSLETNFRRISTSYDQPGLIGDTEYNTEDWFNYQVEENLPVSAGVLAGRDIVVNNQDQTYEQLRARARYSYTKKLNFDVSGGGELRQFESGAPEAFSPVFSISASYQAAERTILNLTGSEQKSASDLNGYNYNSTGAALAVSQGITDRFTADFSVGYYALDYTPVGGAAGLAKYTEDYYTARIGLEAKIFRHLTGQIYYQLTSLQSQTTGDVKDDQTRVQLTLSF
jgi:hypothetical protein